MLSARPGPCKSNGEAEQSSMDFMTIVKTDYKGCIVCSLALGASQSNICKSTSSSNSDSTIGTSVSASGPLGPSPLRRPLTLTLASSCDMRVNVEGDSENLFKTSEFHRSGEHADLVLGPTVSANVKKAPTQPTTPMMPSTRQIKIPNPHSIRDLPTEDTSTQNSSATKAAKPIKQPKFREGHMSSLSVSFDEEENTRSQRARILAPYEGTIVVAPRVPRCSYTTSPFTIGTIMYYNYKFCAQGSG